MKLHLSLCIAFFLFGTALSGPLDDNLRRAQQPGFERVNAQDFANVQGYLTRNFDQPIVQNVPNNVQETGGPGYVEEIEDQVQATGEEAQVQSYRSVPQGATIALQALYDKRSWVGCAQNPCRKATCPNLRMEDYDWTNCWGEVFQIYRARGSGNVEVGDVVGLYYPRNPGNWFSTWTGKGRLATCPGMPTNACGFANDEKWFDCAGEVYKIYARGKSLETVIQEHDDIMLYYVRGNNYVSLAGSEVDVRPCPGEARPPPEGRYDSCWGEVFELWLR